MTSIRLQQLETALQGRVQGGHLRVDEQAADLPEITGVLARQPERRLELSDAVVELEGDTLTVSGRWTGAYQLAPTASVAGAEVTVPNEFVIATV